MSNGLVSIAFACNDERGNFTHVIESVNIGDELLNLENNLLNPRNPKIEFNYLLNQSGGFAADKVTGYVKIGRRKFGILGYKNWWGNWCWDMVVVTPETAKQIIDYLKSLKRFGVECGETSFYEKFQIEGDFEWTDHELNLLKTDGWQHP